MFFERKEATCFDFKVQPNGHITYFNSHPLGSHYVEMDSTYTIVDYWAMKNGYSTDLHGMQILPNGHVLLMSYDHQQVDMSKVVPGGDPNATVVGLIIQEQDEHHNVLFEWRSWDHFNITDAAPNVDLTHDYIDYVHGNAFELDQDGAIMISSRHLNEITKIDRKTGEIIWRWGGLHNEFVFINDATGFSHQHDIRRLPNGNVTLFDNGNRNSPIRSRAVEYKLDEVSKTAELVWEYGGESPRFSLAMGSMQRLQNGNSLIGWGAPVEGARKRAVSEVRTDGSVVFELRTDSNVVTYRAFRFPWNGKSAIPYLWTDDMNNTKSDSLRLKMVMFGREDIAAFEVYQGPTQYPPPSTLVERISGNELVIRGLRAWQQPCLPCPCIDGCGRSHRVFQIPASQSSSVRPCDCRGIWRGVEFGSRGGWNRPDSFILPNRLKIQVKIHCKYLRSCLKTTMEVRLKSSRAIRLLLP